MDSLCQQLDAALQIKKTTYGEYTPLPSPDHHLPHVGEVNHMQSNKWELRKEKLDTSG